MRSLLLTLAVVLPCGVLGSTIAVGPGKQFARIEEAVTAAGPGDVIQVFPLDGGAAYKAPALLIRKERLTIRGMGGARRVKLDGAGFSYSGAGSVPRAIVQFNPGADGCVVEGFEIAGAHNDSHNGAGVRINQANRVTVRDCDIHGNDMGVMSNGDGTPRTGADQLIERCFIHANGDRSEPGYNHNLYLGGTSVTLRGCEVAASLTGHNVKSRAHVTRVEACYIHDSANRELDLVDAEDTGAPHSDAIVIGCVIVKARPCEGNRGVVHFGQDGGRDHNGTLYLVNCTIVTPYVSPVADLSAAGAKAVVANNIVWDGGAHQAGQQLVSLRGPSAGACTVRRNWLASGFQAAPGDNILASRDVAPPFADASNGDYRLIRSLGKGVPLADLAIPGFNELWQYVPALHIERRSDEASPELGASGPAARRSTPGGNSIRARRAPPDRMLRHRRSALIPKHRKLAVAPEQAKPVAEVGAHAAAIVLLAHQPQLAEHLVRGARAHLAAAAPAEAIVGVGEQHRARAVRLDLAKLPERVVNQVVVRAGSQVAPGLPTVLVVLISGVGHHRIRPVSDGR